MESKLEIFAARMKALEKLDETTCSNYNERRQQMYDEAPKLLLLSMFFWLSILHPIDMYRELRKRRDK